MSLPATLTFLVLVTSAVGLSPMTVKSATGAQAQERDLYVSVLDKDDGMPVDGLGPADFLVREDGVQREVLRVRAATTPMQIAVLADNSEAARPIMGDLRRALRGFVADLQQRENEIALIAFGDRPTILVDSTTDPERITQGIGRLFPQMDSGSYLLDALYNTLEGFRKREAGRPVALVITTEGEEFSTSHHERILDALADTGAALHVVIVGPGGGGGSEAARSRSIALSNGTSASGGRWDHLFTARALIPKLEEVARELNSQYLVSYARPESLIPPETVTIGVTRPELVARGTLVKGAGLR